MSDDYRTKEDNLLAVLELRNKAMMETIIKRELEEARRRELEIERIEKARAKKAAEEKRTSRM